jgi:hypothetical protein
VDIGGIIPFSHMLHNNINFSISILWLLLLLLLPFIVRQIVIIIFFIYNIRLLLQQQHLVFVHNICLDVLTTIITAIEREGMIWNVDERAMNDGMVILICMYIYREHVCNYKLQFCYKLNEKKRSKKYIKNHFLLKPSTKPCHLHFCTSKRIVQILVEYVCVCKK